MLATLYNKGNVQESPPLFWSHRTQETFEWSLLHLQIQKLTISFLVLSKRLTKFLTVNNYINEKVQKAFLPGNNGTIEHSVVLEEIISRAKTNKKTVHVTFFDLEDAFGSEPSVPHPLILHNFWGKRFNYQLSHVFTGNFSSDGLPF